MSEQNVFLIGLMAVGKSTVGRRLASTLDRQFVDSDDEIERRAGAAISWIFDVEGEEGFRDREQQVIDDLSQRQGIVLATGGGAVLREINRQRLSQRGVVVHLHSPLKRLLARTKNDRNRPLLQTANPKKVLKILRAARTSVCRNSRYKNDHSPTKYWGLGQPAGEKNPRTRKRDQLTDLAVGSICNNSWLKYRIASIRFS